MAAGRGVVGWGVHVPHGRLDRTAIAPVAGTGGGTGTRAVASYDEDSTTMGVEAARSALRGSDSAVAGLWFATASPAYLDRTNGTTLHAALRLDRTAPAYDALGSVRSALGALRSALRAQGDALVVASDVRVGLPGGPDETAGGDAAGALVLGDERTDGPRRVLAEVLAWESVTEEFVDRWRVPGAPTSQVWEERFGENRYSALGLEALKTGLAAARIGPEDVEQLVVAGPHDRAATSVARRSGILADRVPDRLTGVVGNPGAAQPALLLAAALDRARPGQHIVLVALADGAEVIVLRTTDAIADHRPAQPVAELVASGRPVPYGRYLAWRGLLPVEPPRRPEPGRVSAPAAHRNGEWKYGFVAGGHPDDPHLPPSTTDDVRTPMADAGGTIVTFTVDRLSSSPSPPVVFAVVDFDGGGRLPVELTDVDPDQVAIGGRVAMTFRKLFTADGIHNYFWKARPVRAATEQEA